MDRQKRPDPTKVEMVLGTTPRPTLPSGKSKSHRQADRRRDHREVVYLFGAEVAQLEELARKNGWTKSDILRWSFLKWIEQFQ